MGGETPMSERRLTEPVVLFWLTIAALAVSGIQPYEQLTWFLETFPVMIGLVLVFVTRRSFPLTPMLYRLVFLHSLGLMLGGHYTYARVPLGEWAKEAFDLSRNHYDRLGHFAQGFIPAILTRELLLRQTPLRPGRWMFFLIVSVCLAFSAFYELIEWWAAVILGKGAMEFLGTQGDQWDTQWDMFLALAGSVSSLLVMSRLHDRQLAKLSGPESAGRS